MKIGKINFNTGVVEVFMDVSAAAKDSSLSYAALKKLSKVMMHYSSEDNAIYLGNLHIEGSARGGKRSAKDGSKMLPKQGIE